MPNTYHLTKLPSGLRVATVEMPHMESVSLGIWASVGGRHEPARLSGVSHFVEHLLFKGTKRRSARAISAEVEGVGGYLNAFTTEDHTCYYAKASADHAGRLCDVLFDMYLESTFDPVEVERERGVIREEILMYRDQPSQYVQELLSDVMWPNHPLGRPLTGSLETLAGLSRDEISAFCKCHYNGTNTFVAAAGRVTHEEILALMVRHTGSLQPGKCAKGQRFPISKRKALFKVGVEDVEQTQLAIGFHTAGRHDDRRFALKLLCVILGENMSSRLFQSLRERHGLCYSIHSGLSLFEDAGALNIHVGLEESQVPRAVKLLCTELRRLIDKPVGRAELQRAKDYTIGQNRMGLESTTNQMMWAGESILGYKRVLDPAEVREAFLKVDAESIRQLAAETFQSQNAGIAVVGPSDKEIALRPWLA